MRIINFLLFVTVHEQIKNMHLPGECSPDYANYITFEVASMAC